MKLDEYAAFTATTAVYPEAGSGSEKARNYALFGLASEVGELLGKHKKELRGDLGDPIAKRAALLQELGDIPYYWVRACVEFGIDPEEVLELNFAKLSARKAKGTIKGDGDNR